MVAAPFALIGSIGVVNPCPSPRYGPDTDTDANIDTNAETNTHADAEPTTNISTDAKTMLARTLTPILLQ